MASPVEVVRPLRRAEYDALVALGAFRDERIELLDGALVPMSPIGPPHSSAVQKLMELLLPALLGRATVRAQSPFAAHELSEPEPDIAVVPHGDYASAHPSEAYLIIEVADSSLEHDRDVKLQMYALSGVPEYWIVNLRKRCIEVHTAPAGCAYTLVARVEYGQCVHPQRFSEVEIRVSDVIR
ncbi:MAG: Uma2 family endonuclease [Pseudomonadota bacterium]